MFKRIIFITGFMPYSIYLFVRWIITGKSALDALDDFERWINDK